MGKYSILVYGINDKRQILKTAICGRTLIGLFCLFNNKYRTYISVNTLILVLKSQNFSYK